MNLSKITTILLIGLVVVACKKTNNETKAREAEKVSKTNEDALNYLVEKDNSTLAWKGFAPTKSHHGTIDISEGFFTVDDGKLVGGNFIINMKTIKDLSLDDVQYKAKLESHLASDDFFDVKKNPNAIFTITDIDEEVGMSMVKGNLTIKNIKKNIEFPATIKLNDDSISFKSEPFTIDRTDWGVKFRSGTFTENLKDKLIYDDIEIVVSIRAKKS